MKNLFRTLALRTGLLTADRIVAPLNRIVEDLDALIEHNFDKTAEMLAESLNLSARSRQIADEAAALNVETVDIIEQKKRVAALLGQQA